MRAVITVIGTDKKGIIASVSKILVERNINILDISQTIMQDLFTMIMLVDISEMNTGFDVLSGELETLGRDMDLSIRVQREECFNSMHRI